MSREVFVTRDGCRLAFESVGDGLPVLWQHGLGADRRQPADVFPNLERIRRITFECRGHGESELGDVELLSIASFTEDALALLDHLRIRKAVVGGISLGAAISLRLAALHPDRVSGLILGRPAWVDAPSPDTMSPYAAVAKYIDEFGGEEGLVRFLKSEDLETVRRVSPDNALSLQSLFTRPNPRSTVELLSRISQDAPAIGGLISRIAVPILIVANDQEFVHPVKYAIELHHALPSASLRMITSKSTNPIAYREEFSTAIRSFLSELERAS